MCYTKTFFPKSVFILLNCSGILIALQIFFFIKFSLMPINKTPVCLEISLPLQHDSLSIVTPYKAYKNNTATCMIYKVSILKTYVRWVFSHIQGSKLLSLPPPPPPPPPFTLSFDFLFTRVYCTSATLPVFQVAPLEIMADQGVGFCAWFSGTDKAPGNRTQGGQQLVTVPLPWPNIEQTFQGLTLWLLPFWIQSNTCTCWSNKRKMIQYQFNGNTTTQFVSFQINSLHVYF